jgi:hypothetical protein
LNIVEATPAWLFIPDADDEIFATWCRDQAVVADRLALVFQHVGARQIGLRAR